MFPLCFSERLEKEREILEERAEKRVEILKNLVSKTVDLSTVGADSSKVTRLSLSPLYFFSPLGIVSD